MAVHLVVAGHVFDGVFLCCPFSPRDVLDEIWDLIKSVSEDFPTYSCKYASEVATEGKTNLIIYWLLNNNKIRQKTILLKRSVITIETVVIFNISHKKLP